MESRSTAFAWNYDRAEIIADGVIHAIGVTLGLAGAIAIIVVALDATRGAEFASVLAYIVGLLAMLGLSAAYNMWPVSRAKWWLRRFDHSAIFLLIAGTYTPFVTMMKTGLASGMVLVGVWTTAAAGALLKVLLPGRFDRLSVVLCLLLGWYGATLYEPVLASFTTTTIALLVAGGVLYTIGVIFHGWTSLRFHNAIWHGFVLCAAACHYAAVLECLAELRA